MLGKYRVLFTTGKCCYDFEIKRKYTVLSGDSATGKSEFIDGVKNHLERMEENINTDLFSTLSCKLDMVVFDRSVYKKIGFEFISKGNLLVLIDEHDIDFLARNCKLNCLSEYDNYYIIACRDHIKMSCLPFSVDEIYEIHTSDKKYPLSNDSLFKSKLSPIYYSVKDIVKPTKILVEDKKSGFEFFNHVFGNKCISADGNGNVEKILRELYRGNKDGVYYVVVDGASFGPYIKSLLDFTELHNCNVCVYSPESFEWLILKALFYKGKVADFIDKPYLFGDSMKFKSWERYYTYLLCKLTKGTYKEYTKSKLNEFYLQDKNVEKVMSIIPDILK